MYYARVQFRTSNCFLYYYFFIIPTRKQDLDEAFGQNGQKTHWNIKDDSQGHKGRYELSFSKLQGSLLEITVVRWKCMAVVMI